MARKTRQVETRLVSEYIKERYPKFPGLLNQPLGIISEELLRTEGFQRGLAMQRPGRPAIDAIIILPKYLLLIEAKVWNVVNGLAKLPLYKALVPTTPELQKYMPRGLIMQLVVGWTNSNLERMANKINVSVKLYRPEWLVEVVEGMHKYWTKEYQEERLNRLRMRQYFGVE